MKYCTHLRWTVWLLLGLFLAGCSDSKTPNPLEEFSDGHTRLVWWQNSGGDAFDLMALDSGTGEERVLLEGLTGRGSDYPPGLALITHDGARVVFSVHDERLVKVMDWEGAGLRVIASGYLADVWYDENLDIEWAYSLSVPRFDPVDPVIRYDIDDPRNRETVWTHQVTWEFRVSGDGKKAAVSCPWPDVGMADLSDGETIQPYAPGCWADVSPDSKHRLIHFTDGNHREIRAYDDHAENPRSIEIGDVLGRQGEGLFLLWTNHPRFVTLSMPWKAEDCDMYLIRMNESLSGIEDFFVIGENNNSRDISASAWIDQDKTLDASVLSFSASSSSIVTGGGTKLSWSTKNAELVSIEPGIGRIEEHGEIAVSPAETTAYVLTAQAKSGPVTRRLIVHVLPLREADEVEGLLPGLSAEYYALAAPEKLPDFSVLSPFHRGHVPNLFFEPTLGDFATSGRSYDLGAVLSGFFHAPAAGLYTFYLRSDDGSRLLVGDHAVVDNDFLHPFIERSGSVGLGAGLHPIRLEYFDQGGEAGLIVEYEGLDLPRRVIPSSSFYRAPMEPEMQIDSPALFFSRSLSGGNPPAQSVEIRNGGDGVLAPVQNSVSYEEGGVGWLVISPSGEGNDQLLQHEVLSDLLAEGRHAAVVTLSCENTAGQSPVYPVSLTVTDQALTLDRIWVDPTASIIEAGESLALSAGAVDQFGSPLAAIMDWHVDGGGLMVPSTSGDAVFAHVSRFSSDGTVGQVQINASSEGVSAASTLQVVDGRFPRITIFEPVMGDRWEVGSVRHIGWESRGVEGVRLYLSTDGGESWTLIVPVVDVDDDDWGNYALLVPNHSSDQCLIQIEGYFQETSEISAMFSIF